MSRALVGVCALVTCIAVPACVVPGADVRTQHPDTVRLDLADIAPPPTETSRMSVVAQPLPEPQLWTTLRHRLRDRLPHAEPGVSVIAAPTLIRGMLDTVPGIGMEGTF